MIETTTFQQLPLPSTQHQLHLGGVAAKFLVGHLCESKFRNGKLLWLLRLDFGDLASVSWQKCEELGLMNGKG
jgi:hypothetical protein